VCWIGCACGADNHFHFWGGCDDSNFAFVVLNNLTTRCGNLQEIDRKGKANQGDQMSLLKIGQNVAQPVFVKINTYILQWKRVAQNLGEFRNSKKTAQSN
jgi:hypothetical protein